MLSAAEIRRGFFAKLTAGTAVTTHVGTRIYHALAPAEAAYPLIIFNRQAGTPTHTFGGLAWDSQVWLVKCVARDTSSTVAETVQAAVDELLDGANLSVTGGTVFDLRRESDVDYIEPVDGQQYRHHGSLFRLIVR